MRIEFRTDKGMVCDLAIGDKPYDHGFFRFDLCTSDEEFSCTCSNISRKDLEKVHDVIGEILGTGEAQGAGMNSKDLYRELRIVSTDDEDQMLDNMLERAGFVKSTTGDFGWHRPDQYTVTWTWAGDADSPEDAEDQAREWLGTGPGCEVSEL